MDIRDRRLKARLSKWSTCSVETKRGLVKPRKVTMFKRFLSYYKPQMGLFVADTVCALVLAAIDLAFPIILRNLTGGLFTQGQAAFLQALGMSAQVLPQASSYLDIIIKFEIGFGFAFELPVVVFYLVIFDIIPYKKMRGQWRTIYVVLMVLCAMITPDASPITMLLMFAALVVLYEASLLLARIVLSKRIKKQNAELAAEEAED